MAKKKRKPKAFDPYVTLGVERTASNDAIRKAYRTLSMQFHPDRNPGDQDAANKFQELARAWKVLGDPATRAHYDLTGDPNKPTDHEDAEALKAIFMVFMGLIEGYWKQNVNPISQDLPGKLQQHFEGKREECLQGINVIKKTRQTLEDCKGRFGVKDGENYVDENLAYLKNVADMNLAMANDNLALCERCIRLVKRFSFAKLLGAAEKHRQQGTDYRNILGNFVVFQTH